MNTEGLDIPPMHRAADEGDVAEIQRLVSAGGDVNASWDDSASRGFFTGLTPLMLAAGSTVGSVEAVQLLLDLGADPLAKSGAGATALWLAAEYSHSHNVAILLNVGSDPLVEISNGMSALAVAAQADDVDTVRLLLAAGALPEPTGIPPQRKNVLPSTPLSDWSFESMRKYYTDSWPSYTIPLFAAAESGGANCIPILIEAGANPNFLDNNSGSALMHASSSTAVEALIDAGCSLHTRDTFDRTAFSRALEGSEGVEAAKALIRAGVDLEELDSYGRTVLLSLCGSLTIEVEMVRLLLDAGANIHATAPHFGTALHCAAQLFGGDRRGLLGDVIRLLVGAGLPVDIRDENGDTPLQKAVGDEGIDLSAVEALLELGADPGGAICHGAAAHVKMWEGIVSNPPALPENSFMLEGYDREAGLKECLESARFVLRILEKAVADRSVSA